jgi:hypothetical protein
MLTIGYDSGWEVLLVHFRDRGDIRHTTEKLQTEKAGRLVGARLENGVERVVTVRPV